MAHSPIRYYQPQLPSKLQILSDYRRGFGFVIGFIDRTVLQAGWSSVRVLDEVDVFKLPKPSSRTMALESTQPLREMSTRNFSGAKKQPARRAANLAALYAPNV
jgi:hypothetical protein